MFCEISIKCDRRWFTVISKVTTVIEPDNVSPNKTLLSGCLAQPWARVHARTGGQHHSPPVLSSLSCQPCKLVPLDAYLSLTRQVLGALGLLLKTVGPAYHLELCHFQPLQFDSFLEML